MRIASTLVFLLLIISSVAGYVQPSKRAKERYEDLRKKAEAERKEFKAKKDQLHRSFQETGEVDSADKTLFAKDSEKENLMENLRSMIYLSSLVYAFASVRKAVNEGGIKQSRWPWAKRIPLENANLILDNENCNKREPGCLKHSLTGSTLEKILCKDNMKLLLNDKELANKLNVDAVEAMKELGDDGILWEFDDRIGDERELVYGITVNKRTKRITVVFRGSVSLRDWLTNLTVGPKKLQVPASLEASNFGFTGKKDSIAVHSGFYNYLEQSMDHLLDQLKKALKLFPDYEIIVTGHSLGGALASLLSYQLASSSNHDLPLPITCISYASPLVGNASFQQAYFALEQLGRLRHVRLSNELDVIPLSPPLSGYVQTGINLHLERGGNYSLSYSNNSAAKSLWSQARWKSLDAHSLVTHWERGQEAAKSFLKNGAWDGLDVSELYKRFLPETLSTSAE